MFIDGKLKLWQLMFSKFEFDGKLNPTFVEGAFKLPLSSIRAYLTEPITPRISLLVFRVVLEQGEDLIRESGIPYTIVRPCALTEELAGADLIFDQGDNITVYNPIEDHYSLFVVCLVIYQERRLLRFVLESPFASGKTFEVTARLMSLNCGLCAVAVKSVVTFSEPFTVDPQNPPPEKD
ncbi:unnamed protein product [Prunus armeniaca]